MELLGEISVFVRAAELRSFTRTAERIGMTPSGVSRVITRLEERLGTQLLNRTTRSVSLTDDGARYLERCARILTELEQANAELAQGQVTPRGRLRVDAAVVLGEFVLAPALPRFLQHNPELSVDLTLRDQLIDPTAEGVDVVLRLADLKDTELLSKRLGTARMVTVAAPSYLKEHGRPRSLAELQRHACLPYLSGSPRAWRFRGSTGEREVPVSGRLHTNSASALREAALAGAGLIQVFEHHISRELSSGALVPVLEDEAPSPRTVYALYARAKISQPKVRAFLDFAAELFAPRKR